MRSTDWTIEVVNQKIDPHVLVHDGGSRRQDSHGLFESVCDGPTGGLKDQFQVAFATIRIRTGTEL